MWQRIKFICLNAMISVSIGLMIGLTILLLPKYQLDVKWAIYILLRTSLYGLIIGSVSVTSIIALRRYLLEKPSWGYGIVFLITGIGCTMTAYPFDQPFAYTILISAVAETLAIVATFINVRYLKMLNKNLKRKQAELKQNIP